MKAKKKQPKKKYKTIDLKQLIESNPEHHKIVKQVKEDGALDDESDEESHLAYMEISDIFPVCPTEGNIYFVATMNFDHIAYRE